jgi:hypothetical protein
MTTTSTTPTGQRPRSRAEDALRLIVTLVIAGICAAGSFTHVHTVAEQHGQRGWIAWAIAVVAELVALVAGLEARRARRAGESAGLAIGLVVLWLGFAIAANLATAQHTVWGYLTAAVPILGLACVGELFLKGLGATTPPAAGEQGDRLPEPVSREPQPVRAEPAPATRREPAPGGSRPRTTVAPAVREPGAGAGSAAPAGEPGLVQGNGSRRPAPVQSRREPAAAIAADSAPPPPVRAVLDQVADRIEAASTKREALLVMWSSIPAEAQTTQVREYLAGMAGLHPKTAARYLRETGSGSPEPDEAETEPTVRRIESARRGAATTQGAGASEGAGSGEPEPTVWEPARQTAAR